MVLEPDKPLACFLVCKRQYYLALQAGRVEDEMEKPLAAPGLKQSTSGKAAATGNPRPPIFAPAHERVQNKLPQQAVATHNSTPSICQRLCLQTPLDTLPLPLVFVPMPPPQPGPP